MSSLREADFDKFLKRDLAKANGILIHGNEEAAVALLARQAVSAVGGPARQLDVATLKASPGLLADEILALDMFGARSVLMIEGADEHALKFLEPVFALDAAGNFAVVTASLLGKTSKLRAAAEAAGNFGCLAVYEEDEERLKLRIRNILAAHALKWGDGAEDAFFASVGSERAIVAQEAEKLALYAKGQTEVSAVDVAAICGDTAEFGVDEAIDTVLSGDLETADRVISSGGLDARGLFILFQSHVARLQGFHAEMEKGMSADAALRAARPPVFFKRQSAMLAQLRRLSLADLNSIQQTLQDAVFASRAHADLAPAITSRAFLSIARLSRARAG